MKELVCQQCGAPLVQKDNKHWYCPHCKLSYLADRDEEGYEFLYQPIEKKSITGGQISQKATTLQTHKIAVREIKVNDNIDVEVARDALQLDKEEAIRAIEAHLGHGEYEKASEEINRYLARDNNCAEILFDSILCEKKFVLKDKPDGRRVLDGKFTPFSMENKKTVECILANASPRFANRVINSLLRADFSDDDSCERILEECIPYVPNESIYPFQTQQRIFQYLFNTIISKGFPKSFDYLLNTLDESSVDDYINYNLRFVQKICEYRSWDARKYLLNVLSVESGNVEALRKLVEVDLVCDSVPEQESIADLEKYLGFVANPDEAVLSILDFLMQRSMLTKYQSRFVRKLIGYHSAAPHGLQKELLNFANKLLKSSLFAEAIEYFHLILSFDKKCRDAFWGLCLAGIQAKDELDIVNKESLLKDCMEFSKCIALSNDEEQDKIYRLAKQQENKLKEKERQIKNARKKRITLIATAASCIAIIIAIIIGVSASNAIKKRQYEKTYSVDNAVMTVTRKEAGTSNSFYYDTLAVNLYFDIENKSTVDIARIQGKMNVYKGDATFLMTWDVTIQDIPAGVISKKTINCQARQNSEMIEFYNASLDDLKITYIVSSMQYVHENGGYEYIENSKSVEKVIKPYDAQGVAVKKEEQYKKALALMAQKKYAEAYQIFDELGDYKDSADRMEEAYSLSLQADKESRYQKAISYMQVRKYDEAYQIFSELGDYKDSAYKMTEISNLVQRDKDESNYQSALVLYRQEEYVKAYRKFLEISNYKDSAGYIQNIYDKIDAVAKSYADAGEYKLAYDKMLEIDEDVPAYNYANQKKWKSAVNDGLTKIVLKEGTESIKSSEFSDCYLLKEIILPSSLTVIGANAFENCYSLTSITIPSNIYSIGDDAFLNCYKLLEVYNLSSYLSINAQSQYFGKVAYYAKDVFTSLSQNSHIEVTSDKFVFFIKDEDAFLIGYNGNDAEITLPTTIHGKQYNIYQYAFYGNNHIQSLNNMKGITSVGDSAFAKCAKLVSVNVGNTVTTIGVGAFSNCEALNNVVMGENVTTIGASAFYYCSALKTITIPVSIVQIGRWAFYETDLASAFFNDREGWRCFRGTISSQALSDPAKAAEYLKGYDYGNQEWNKNKN